MIGYSLLVHIFRSDTFLEVVMIVSLGEALIDFIYNESGGKSSFTPAPGGSPFNTAIAIRRLAVPTVYVSKLSTDLFGNMLVAHLEDNEVDTSALLRSSRPTTLAFAKIVNHKAEYAFYTNGSADRSITASEISKAIHSLPAPPECIQIGSISLALEPGAQAIHDIILARDQRIMVSFDPNIRPSMVDDRGVYLKRLEDLFTSVNIVKISDEDLEWIYPELDLDDAARLILSKGPQACVVTHGIKGSYWFGEGFKAFAPTNPITVVDTIGAGDTFHAGLLAYLYRESLLTRPGLSGISERQAELALTFATHAAEGTCKKQGADPPRIDEVLALMPRT